FQLCQRWSSHDFSSPVDSPLNPTTIKYCLTEFQCAVVNADEDDRLVQENLDTLLVGLVAVASSQSTPRQLAWKYRAACEADHPDGSYQTQVFREIQRSRRQARRSLEC